MSKFMLFVIGGYESEKDLSPEQLQQRLVKYRDWSLQMREQGKLVDASKITDEPHVLVRDNGEFHVQHPAITPDTVGGYFIIDAENYEEAVQLAQGCPIFEYDGYLEIRKIER